MVKGRAHQKQREREKMFNKLDAKRSNKGSSPADAQDLIRILFRRMRIRLITQKLSSAIEIR